MAERSTVRILLLDGQERTFTNVRVDQETAGWLFLTRLQDSPIISGVPAPIAAYRLETLQAWEYVQAEPQADPSMHGGGGESAEHGENGDGSGK